MGLADKDLSMAHFHGTEGWKEGGRESLSDCGKGCRAGGPEFYRVAEKTPAGRQTSISN